MGTPQEDAFRRDLTINSLFYNLNENKLEDWTNNVCFFFLFFKILVQIKTV